MPDLHAHHPDPRPTRDPGPLRPGQSMHVILPGGESYEAVVIYEGRPGKWNKDMVRAKYRRNDGTPQKRTYVGWFKKEWCYPDREQESTAATSPSGMPATGDERR